jgi:hypothetical protein
VVAGGIRLGTKFGDDFAVDLYAARGDEILGGTAAGDSGLGEDFLQALELTGGFAASFWLGGVDSLVCFLRVLPFSIGVFDHGFCLGVTCLLKCVTGSFCLFFGRSRIVFGAVELWLVGVGAHIVAHEEISVLPAAFSVRLGRRGLCAESRRLFSRFSFLVGFAHGCRSLRGVFSRR